MSKSTHVLFAVVVSKVSNALRERMVLSLKQYERNNLGNKTLFTVRAILARNGYSYFSVFLFCFVLFFCSPLNQAANYKFFLHLSCPTTRLEAEAWFSPAMQAQAQAQT